MIKFKDTGGGATEKLSTALDQNRQNTIETHQSSPFTAMTTIKNTDTCTISTVFNVNANIVIVKSRIKGADIFSTVNGLFIYNFNPHQFVIEDYTTMTNTISLSMVKHLKFSFEGNTILLFFAEEYHLGNIERTLSELYSNTKLCLFAVSTEGQVWLRYGNYNSDNNETFTIDKTQTTYTKATAPPFYKNQFNESNVDDHSTDIDKGPPKYDMLNADPGISMNDNEQIILTPDSENEAHVIKNRKKGLFSTMAGMVR